MLPKPALRSKDDDDDEDAPPRMLSTVIKLPPHLAILDEVHIDARYAGSVCKAITKTAEQVSGMHDCRWDPGCSFQAVILRTGAPPHGDRAARPD